MTKTNSNNDNQDVYQRMRQRTSRWLNQHGRAHQLAEFIFAGPDILHLLLKLSLDSTVSLKNRLKLSGTLAYIFSPIDLLPGAIFGPAGLLDDIALAAYMIRDVMEDVGRKKFKRYWAGPDHILDLVDDLLYFINERFGFGDLKKLLARLP